MTLHDASSVEIETAQANAVWNAGRGLDGWFSYGGYGWELTLRHLTFAELLRVLETVKAVLQ